MHEHKRHDFVIDFLRVIAVIGVVWIHTTTHTLEVWNYNFKSIPWTFFLNQILRFSVPLFFLISGYLLELNYPFHVSRIAYLKKRFNRIFIPYIFWSTIYYCFIYTKHHESLLHGILVGNASYHLYFIPTIAIFYLIFPFIHASFQFITTKRVMIFLGIVQLLFLYYDYYVKPFPFYYPLSIALLNFYVFFIGVFAALHREQILTVIKKRKIILFVLTFLCGVYILFEGMVFYIITHNYLAIYSQWRPSVLIYTILVTATLYVMGRHIKSYQPFIRYLSRLSFFVFFIHVIVLEVVWRKFEMYIFHFSKITYTQQFIYYPLFIVLVTFFSFGIASVVHKIPWLSRLTG